MADTSPHAPFEPAQTSTPIEVRPGQLDLTEVVEASARAAYEGAADERDEAWEGLPAVHRHDMREVALVFITVAAPLIEAQVREMVAREIEADRDRLYSGDLTAQRIIRSVLTDAVNLARGGAR